VVVQLAGRLYEFEIDWAEIEIMSEEATTEAVDEPPGSPSDANMGELRR
jgi:hypothetical protein